MTDQPTVTIDYTPAIAQRAGIGRLVRDLVGTLLKQHDNQCAFAPRLFIQGYDRHHPALPSNVPIVTTRISSRWLARLWHRVHIPLPVEWLSGDTMLYHATDFVLPPTLPTTRTIVTIHDLSFVHVPEAASARLRAYLEQVVPQSIQRADCVIADSDATRMDCIQFYGVSAEKIVTVYSGLSSTFHSSFSSMTTRSDLRLPSAPYIFTVGTVQPRKNYARLIEALAILRQRGYDLELVIAGGKGWLEDDMYKTLQTTGLQDVVHLLGYVDDADLPALYQNAACVAYPSLYEGFGFPILEAMACNTPVVTSDRSSMPEVAGDAALLVDPYDLEAITHAIQQLLEDTTLRQTLITRGRERIQHFTWERSAAKLARIYESVLDT